MADLYEEKRKCNLCGAYATCFDLEYASCPELAEKDKESTVGCLECLQTGRFEFWHDTEIGMLDENGLSLIYSHHKPTPASFPLSALTDLRRTPQIVTWQQEIWLTHCNDFMAYIGTWKPATFVMHAPDGNGRALFMEMTDSDLSHLWDDSLEPGEKYLGNWHATYYAFQCLHCGKLRGNWDCH